MLSSSSMVVILTHNSNGRILIGLVGSAGSGKNTVGNYLLSKGFVGDSFARPVKDCLSIIMGWDRYLLEGDSAESRRWREQFDDRWSKVAGRQITPRLAMQIFGTDLMREKFAQSVWVESIRQSLIQRNDTNFVITDCRFTNEIDMIKSMGGVIVHVCRGETPPWHYDAIKAANGSWFHSIKMKYYWHIHKSEYEWRSTVGMYKIDNSGSLENLHNQVDMLLDFIVNSK